MKDEEMAEQFADNINGLDLTCSLLSAKDKSHAYRLGRYDGFLAGLKAGRPQWHDLRKDPNDLPEGKEGSLYSPTVLKEDRMTCSYNYNEQCWETSGGVRMKEPPIAWCEIPTFDKE